VLGAVIAEFIGAAREGRVRRTEDRPYSREQLRDLRASLSHVDSALGASDIGLLRPWRIQKLIDGLRDAGLSQRRLSSMLDALRALFAYAVGRGLITSSPVVGVTTPWPDAPTEPRTEEPRPGRSEALRPALFDEPHALAVDERPTPTYAVLSLVTSAVTWTVRFIVIAFALLGVALVLEFA
jgi:hypothetical protein